MASSMTVKAAKAALRAEIKGKVSALSDTEKQRQSKIVTKKLFEMREFRECKRVSVFLSMSDEISTDEILAETFRQGKTCFIPRYFKKSNQMDMVLLESMEAYHNLPVTSWNIKQPAEGDASVETAVSGGGLDVVLMPGLAFTVSGQRLGRGRGYYDTYLSHYESRVPHRGGRPLTIALAFTQQICDHVPTSDDDVPVDHVLYAEDGE